MKDDEKEVFELMKERILKRIEKETWGAFSLKKYDLYNNDVDKEISFFFEKEEWGFELSLFTKKIGENWIEHMMMGVGVYKKTTEKTDPLTYRSVRDEPEAFEKIYNIVKEEFECMFKKNKSLRLKYLFHEKEMFQQTNYLRRLLEDIEKKKG